MFFTNRSTYRFTQTLLTTIGCIALYLISINAQADKRVIILGFDGADPNIVKTMMDAGELPNLEKLSKQGTFVPLASSNPPQSPIAWSSFATGKHPGNHGIYDFLRRDPKTYFPSVAFGQVVNPTLNPDGSFRTIPTYKNNRKGRTFWKIASNEGVRAKILSVPFAFPADTLEEGCMLSGLGVPDLRSTDSVFFLMGEDIPKPSNISGGKKIPLRFSGDTAIATIEGVKLPGVKPLTYSKVPVIITANRKEKSVSIKVSDQTIDLKEGTWSPWVKWSFDMSPNIKAKPASGIQLSPKVKAHAISRFHLLEAGDTIRLYMTCLQYDPTKPYINFTSPPEYGKELFERYGYFKTIGWIYDTNALKHDALTDDLFLEDVKKTMGWREILTLDEIDAGKFELLISAWTGTDRVGHLFWHHRDELHPMHTAEGKAKYGRAIEDTYTRMDSIVGKVMAKLGEEDLLMVISDHGFHSFRKGFNVNTWLVRNGYLSVTGKSDPKTATNPKPFLFGYDWSRTKAYNIGLGSIFLNLKGREGKGIVPSEEADALIAEIREKLLKVTDPDTGDKIFTEIYTRDFFKGKATTLAPDLQLGYADGYQSSKSAASGKAPAEMFEDTMSKWSGEHAASDMATTPGIFFSNQPITKKDPHLVDLGATALEYLGKTVPGDFEGEGLKPIKDSK